MMPIVRFARMCPAVLAACRGLRVGQCGRKMLFGSDYPLIAPDRWIKDFKEAGFKPEVGELILKGNAMAVLGLGGESA